MYNDCEICGTRGRLVGLFGAAINAELCFKHCRELDEWAVNYPPWAEWLKGRDEMHILNAHAQGGADCRAEMQTLATRLRALRLELYDAASKWIKGRAAQEAASEDKTIVGR